MPCLSWVQFCFMMGATVAGPVPIIVANAVTVPMTYCFDIIVKGVEFSTVSLTGAVRMLPFKQNHKQTGVLLSSTFR